MHRTPPPLIKLPNGAWVRPDLITAVIPYDGSGVASATVKVAHTCGAELIRCPDYEAAFSLAQVIAEQVNAAS